MISSVMAGADVWAASGVAACGVADCAIAPEEKQITAALKVQRPNI